MLAAAVVLDGARWIFVRIRVAVSCKGHAQKIEPWPLSGKGRDGAYLD
jgi:hypothetical protein